MQQGSKAALAKAKSIGAKTLEELPKVVASGNVTWETFALETGKQLLKAEAMKVWKDDIFPPSLQSLRVTKKNFTWANEKLGSPRKQVIFKGNQGKYYVIYSWRLI